MVHIILPSDNTDLVHKVGKVEAFLTWQPNGWHHQIGALVFLDFI